MKIDNIRHSIYIRTISSYLAHFVWFAELV
jgi:hypothetical protein